MKKILFILAACTAMTAIAQNPEALQKKLEKSNSAIADAKKSSSPGTWLERANIFLDMANVYTNKIAQGIPMEQATAFIGKPNSVEQVVIANVQYNKSDYDNFVVYSAGEQDVVQFFSAKKGNELAALTTSLECLTKVKEISEKDFMSKGFAVCERLQNQFTQTGLTDYNLGDKAKAAQFFDGAVKAADLMGKVDTTMTFYTAVAYCESGKNQEALQMFDKLLAYGDNQGGMVYLYMSMCYENLKDIPKAIEILETGFAKVPTNSALISSLINIYIKNELDSNKLIEMIKKAEELDPQNASLYTVEGVVWDKIGDIEKAAEAYNKALAINSNSFETYYNLGLAYAKAGDAEKVKAEKTDINDQKSYDAFVKQMEEYYVKAINALDKAYELKKDDLSTIEILRQLYFIMRDKDPKYLERYNYFLEITKK